ncbi:hypothetical protein JXC34_04050 [Candidatus Woesearchaeota archaeon]|nr:hypothetical protein [Candidatus Woesearchaeota archaeon]
MVSKKSRPIKKVKAKKTVKKEAKEKPVQIQAKKTTVKKGESTLGWKALTIVFAVLLVASIFTAGFRLNQLDNARNNLNSLLAKDLPEEAKTHIQEALTSLENAGSIVDQEKSQSVSFIEKVKSLFPTKSGYRGEKAKLEFYVMSQCPFGTQVEDAIAPVLAKMGDGIEFSLDFIVSEQADGSFRSLHGDPETNGDIVQLCAIKYNAEDYKYMDMIVCMNQNAGAIPVNWEQCAIDNGLQTEKIKACYEGEEGKNLLRESIARSNQANAQGSPTMYLNGQLYSGGRDETSFMTAICDQLEGHPECDKIPQPAKVNLIFINDKKCAECQQYAGIVDQLNSLFRGLEVTEYDFEDAEGRKLFDELSLRYLPAFLFDETVEDGENYQNLQIYLQETGEYYLLKITTSFNPLGEICDNEVDDRDMDGLIDCEDDECAESLVCREEKENHVQVFIMSDCPYGRKAVEALKEVKDNFDSLDFEVHYIASEQGDGFSSLHGQYEVDEDIIQLCAKEHSPEQWFDYVYCRSTKGVSGIDWKECASETGVDTEAVQQCFEGEEGKSLLREDIKIANALGIGASPTWLANNRYEFSGITAEVVKNNVCQHNDMAGCENSLSTVTGGVAEGTC